MENQSDIRQFLATRRARLTPQQAGLPDFGGRRRVPGLRRGEVALLAGMSTEYYVRLERGNAKGVSEAVLDGISRALQLDDAERTHLHDLVRAANTMTSAQHRRPSKTQQVGPGIQQLLDAMTGVPAVVQNGRLDIVAANQLGRALFSELYAQASSTGRAGQPANFMRFLFLSPAARDMYIHWDDAAQQTVAMLRTEAGRASEDRALSALVGELSTRSEDFRVLWASHDVRLHSTGNRNIHHPIVGDLELNYQAMPLSPGNNLLFIAFTAQPGTPSHDNLQLLASWAATTNQAQAMGTPSPSDTR
ncbi:helix-turn-helix transcriptional regulator [Arthrobacter sp. ISL-5]|uniref:helix-turn-helix transcriptional regulator n=1 Tax=Arthrobacter sp. ISL-5 TaxID=2819111 RepID=UPI001BE6F09C|nr:helix-turn-helix transcriptional regulator [Arthrobacter sp. ISL-5]MBT2551755.1 helix-turn-helix domain-containing protein [Arthrobacter sp. ISL-5]